MRSKAGFFLLVFSFPVFLYGQNQPNIVPNPGFELYDNVPIGWFYKGEHFDKAMKYWSSPTGASPDAFGPKIKIPPSWAEKGFGKQKARTGISMIGLTVYGCEDGKPHCREYVQIQLLEPLVVGQEYAVEMWVTKLPNAIEIDNLGFFFSRSAIDIPTDELLPFPPQVRATGIISPEEKEWVQVSGRFTAQTPADYLLIGNFFPDSLTSIKRKVTEEALKFGYYYIDDVAVRKIPPIRPVVETELNILPLEVGKVIRLENIYFEFDEWELLPRSFIELDKLAAILKEYPKLVIQVNGHTDNIGSEAYNQYLSRKRAKSVVAYLNEKGIGRGRMVYKGFGYSQPIATNDTPEGRQLNRRVEFEILKF